MTVLTQWRAQRQHQRALAHPAGAWASATPHTSAQRLAAGVGGAHLRSYMAASTDRLVADLLGGMGAVSGNAEVRGSLRTLRQRSRQLANDNEFVKRFLQLIRNNVVGARGFELQMKIYRQRGGLLDAAANEQIETAYCEFSRAGTYTACGQMSRGAFERAAMQRLASDGELIIEKLYGKQFGRFGLTWRLIDPDLLDESLNLRHGGVITGYGRLADGHEIRMGVERNAYDRPVAYWFHAQHPGDDLHSLSSTAYRRVPADRILHKFLNEDLRPGTSRGVPWIYAGLRRMAMLNGYEEAALVSARQGASKMGFYKPPESKGNGMLADGSGVASGQDAAGNLVDEAEPGTFGVLPAGWDFTTYDPAYPNDKMEAFVKQMLRAFSAGVGLTYNTLASDLEGVSLSSMRHGANQDRDTYEALQHWFKEHISLPMFEEWLSLALGLGQIGRLPPDGFERFNKPRFIGRPWRSPDPQKDVAASAQAVALGITSRTRVCAERGEEFQEILEELASEENMARTLGVTLNTDSASAHKTPAVDDAGKPQKPGAESSDEAGGEDNASGEQNNEANNEGESNDDD